MAWPVWPALLAALVPGRAQEVAEQQNLREFAAACPCARCLCCVQMSRAQGGFLEIFEPSACVGFLDFLR